jgi:hypothetical protein
MLYLLMKQKDMIHRLKITVPMLPLVYQLQVNPVKHLSRGHLEMQNELSASTGSSIFLLEAWSWLSFIHFILCSVVELNH